MSLETNLNHNVKVFIPVDQDESDAKWRHKNTKSLETNLTQNAKVFIQADQDG